MKSGTQNARPGDPASLAGNGQSWIENEMDVTGPAARSSNQASSLKKKS
jgi:hypothetical protein